MQPRILREGSRTHGSRPVRAASSLPVEEPIAPPLTTVFTIAQVAKMAGWTRIRMWRHLTTLNGKLGGKLLCDVSRGAVRPRWTVTLVALQAARQQWFHDPKTLQHQVDELREENAELRSRLERVETIQHMQSDRLRECGSAPRAPRPPRLVAVR